MISSGQLLATIYDPVLPYDRVQLKFGGNSDFVTYMYNVLIKLINCTYEYRTPESEILWHGIGFVAYQKERDQSDPYKDHENLLD